MRGRGATTRAGGEGFDVLHGGLGATRSGGPGNDRVFAAAPRDGNVDIVDGDEGDDRILIRDGIADVVSCGPGIDRARADQNDEVAADCEAVRRADPLNGVGGPHVHRTRHLLIIIILV